MLPHGKSELLALADRVIASEIGLVSGWVVDVWKLDDGDVAAGAEFYGAVLAGGATDAVADLLVIAGLDLPELLIDGEGREEITRSDFTELLGAATLVALDGWDADELLMPNVPKMSRRKSDSGIDVFAVRLSDSPGTLDLEPWETLGIASVKHTIDKSSSGMRYKLAESLGAGELSVPYVTTQLRVLNAHLQEEGYTQQAAARVYLFLRDFPDPELVELYAIGVVDDSLEADLSHQVTLLPAAVVQRFFRMLLVPALSTVHSRCP
jgi:hypothetical protein